MRAIAIPFLALGLSFTACGKKAPESPTPATVEPSAETTPAVAPGEPTAPTGETTPTTAEPGAEPAPERALGERRRDDAARQGVRIALLHSDMAPAAADDPKTYFRSDPGKDDSEPVKKAVAVMRPTADSKAMGVIELEAADEGGCVGPGASDTRRQNMKKPAQLSAPAFPVPAVACP